MKAHQIAPMAVICTTCILAACTSGNGNKAGQNGPDTVRTDTSAIHGSNDTISIRTDSARNQNADPSGRVK